MTKPDGFTAAIARFVDRDSIGDAIDVYLNAVERRDWDRVTDTFAPWAVLDYGTPGVESVEDNVALLRAGVERLTSVSTLLGMQTCVTVTGDVATSMSSAFTTHIPAETEPRRARMSIVRYEDDWIRWPSGGWRITKRITHHELKGWLMLD
jgi:hypothetical protein